MEILKGLLKKGVLKYQFLWDDMIYHYITCQLDSHPLFQVGMMQHIHYHYTLRDKTV